MPKKLQANPGRVLNIGKTGEHLALEFAFDIAEWRKEYGDGTALLVVKRPNEEEKLPIVSYRMEGDEFIWTITSADNNFCGVGECELTYYPSNGAVVKSDKWLIESRHSLGEAGDTPPDRYKDWFDMIMQTSADILSKVEVAVSAADDAKEALEEIKKIISETGGFEWSTIKNKPFERIGETLTVTDGTLEVNIHETTNASGGLTIIIG